jgi:hypothetical protein
MYDLGGRVTDLSDTIGYDLSNGYDTAGRLNSVATKIPGMSKKRQTTGSTRPATAPS